MADFKAGRTAPRTQKLRAPNSKGDRPQPSQGIYTRGNKIMGPEGSCRERLPRPARSNDKIFRGMTLEDYVRGRASSEKLQTEASYSCPKPKDNSVIKLKAQEAALGFEQNYQIEQEDEDNYVQNRESRLAEYDSILPELKHTKKDFNKDHLRTEKSYIDEYESRPIRTKTISEQDVFVPIHTKERLRLEIRRSLGKREQKNSSITKNLQILVSPQKRQKPIHSIKLNTMAEFYRQDKPRDFGSIRVELGYATKYGRRFLERLRGIIPQ